MFSQTHWTAGVFFRKWCMSGVLYFFFSFLCLVLLVFLYQCCWINVMSSLFSLLKVSAEVAAHSWWYKTRNSENWNSEKALFSVKLYPSFLNIVEHFLLLLSRRGHCPCLNVGLCISLFWNWRRFLQNLIASFLNPLKNIDSWKRCTF